MSASRMRIPVRLPRHLVNLPVPLATLVVLCALLTPLLPLIHQATVLAMAVFLRAAAASHAIRDFLAWTGWDPVYASVLNRTIGNIEAKGLAIASPLGDVLYQLAPGLFAPPDKVIPGAWATALVGDGVSVLASAAAKVGTNAAFLAAGVALLVFLLRTGRTKSKPAFLILAFLSAMLQARGLVGLVRRSFSLEDLEIMGLSHVFTKVIPLDAGSYDQFVSGSLQFLAPYLIPTVVIFGTYGCAIAVLLFKTRWQGNRDLRASLFPRRMLRSPMLLLGNHLHPQGLAAVALLVGAVTSPVLLPSLADYNFPLEAAGSNAEVLEESSPAPLEEALSATGNPTGGPSKVIISGSDYAYSYTVNGRTERIRGVGYNPMYSHLPPKERAARYDWDFAQIKAAGINTILGWEREQFDELTLDKAQEYGLGVVMPYFLPGNGDYGNPAYAQRVEQGVKEWVKRYKDSPALRMWGIGNEVIHYINNPNDPRARPFAEFYVRLADEVHSIDPDHPVIYRDAEDVYVAPVRDALRKDGVHRPWFVYGANFFTYRICEALPDFPKKAMDAPLVISEFAPSGLSPEDRPKGYQKMWRCIAKEYPSVLGGFLYVWTTNGPEAIDRTLGLVDAEGQPVDGSFWAMGRAFRRHQDGAPQGSGTPP